MQPQAHESMRSFISPESRKMTLYRQYDYYMSQQEITENNQQKPEEKKNA